MLEKLILQPYIYLFFNRTTIISQKTSRERRFHEFVCVCVIVYKFAGLQSMRCVLDSSIAEKIVASPPAVCVGCP